MEGWSEGEVRRVSKVWHDDDGRPWLAVFDLASIGGRIECVGVALRSTLGPYTCDPATPNVLDLTADELWDWIDPEPVDAAGAPDPDSPAITPRPLSAEALRGFRFAHERDEARGIHADVLRLYAAQEESSPAPWLDPVELRETADLYAIEKPRGRTPKYDRAFLRRVAQVYQEAWDGGEERPSRAVARVLDLDPTTARKLVQKCRAPHVGLLPPAQARKARGWTEEEKRARSERSEP